MEIIMPTYDRLRDNRPVVIEFIPNEDFSCFPYAERYTLSLVSQGKLDFSFNGTQYSLEAPFCLCTNPSDTFEVIDCTPYRCQSIAFHPLFINSAMSFEALEKNEFFALEDEHDRDMMTHFNHLDQDIGEYHTGIFSIPAATYLRISEWVKLIGAEILAQSDWWWTCRIRRYLLQTIYLLDDLWIEEWHKEQEGKKSCVDKALDYIHSNYFSCIELNDVCNISGTNRTKLNKEFKERTGTTVINYLGNYRINIAKHTLTHTNLTLRELADALGYRYESYFIKQFTKIVGMSPSEYREQNRIKRSPHSQQ